MLLIIIFCMVTCKKTNEPLNIILYNKTLSTIQSSIQGKWRLQYTKGGFCSTCIFPPTDSSFLLNIILAPERVSFGNSVRQTLDTTITWLRTSGIPDSTFVMHFFDKNGIPFNIGAYKIYNDTLILYQPFPDGQSFYFNKSN